MISKFFLERPVFAVVISVVITLAGLVCLKALPIEQYPNITPPLILVSASYPGASAQTMSDTVAAPLEQQINGVEDMIYMYSQNAAPGNISLNVYFDIGTDADLALTNVQNRVDLATSQLPEDVQRQGITVTKQSPNILLFVSVASPDGAYDDVFVNNFATIRVADTLARIKGVSNAKVLNALNYSIRIWLRPDIMAQLHLTTSDVLDAVRGQNASRAIGEIGQAPTITPTALTIPVDTLGRLSKPEEYENIILRSNPDGSMVYIKDIGRVELGAQSYDLIGKLNGKTAASIAVYQDYGANALDVAERIKAKMKELEQFFPAGLTYSIPYDTTTYIKVSIQDVQRTLIEAAILVSLVILVFLHSFRATLVPIIAMIVSIIGTFIGMYLLDFSVNTLTLFGMILAVGIVVDDAIVVVENIEHNMRAHNLSSKDAAIKTMHEVTGPVIAIVFVLCAVFIPIGFMGGIAGQLYKQFAITIAVSVVISGFVALTLSPVLAAFLLKKQKAPSRLATRFNESFDKLANLYTKGAGWLLKKAALGLGICFLLIAAIGILFHLTPTSLVPNEDQGFIFVAANLPDGASVARVDAVSSQIEKFAKASPAVSEVLSFSGYSLLEMINRSQIGAYFINLTDWSKRTAKNLQASEVIKALNKEFYSITEGFVMAFNPPAIQGIGIVGGFEFWVVNQGDGTMMDLENAVYQIIEKSKEYPELAGLNTSIQADCMELYIDLDTSKAKAFQVDVSDVYETLQVLLGSVYVNNFNKYGKVFQVVAQAEPQYRTSIEDIGEVYVRSVNGHMIPIKSMVNISFRKAPTLISRFNAFPAAKITGNAAPGFSSGQAIQAMQQLAKDHLPEGMSYEWSGESYQEITAGGASFSALIAGLVMVFLVLAALYERWTLPFTILMAVPFGIFGAFLAVWLRHMNNDVYFQIGLVALIGLSAKNAILIIEFARTKRKEGMGIAEAALDAAKLRFRAIIMTSLTFILGVFPLVFSTGAGAASRHSVGTGVVGGMICATFFAIFFVPLFFKIIETMAERKKEKDEKE